MRVSRAAVDFLTNAYFRVLSTKGILKFLDYSANVILLSVKCLPVTSLMFFMIFFFKFTKKLIHYKTLLSIFHNSHQLATEF